MGRIRCREIPNHLTNFRMEARGLEIRLKQGLFVPFFHSFLKIRIILIDTQNYHSTGIIVAPKLIIALNRKYSWLVYISLLLYHCIYVYECGLCVYMCVGMHLYVHVFICIDTCMHMNVCLTFEILNLIYAKKLMTVVSCSDAQHQQ